MQTVVLSFANSTARETSREAVAAALVGRHFDIIAKAPQPGAEITAPVMGTDDNGLPVVTTPGTYGATTWPLEVVIHDDDAAPAWPADATVATAATSLALAPVAVDLGFPVLTRRQLRHGLLALGITADHVAAVIAAIPDAVQRESARIEFEDAPTMHRDHPLVAALSAAFPQLTTPVIDAAWRQAALI